MTLVMKCDVCNFIDDQPGFDEEAALQNGWKVQDFGHSCYDCTWKLEEAESLEDSKSSSLDEILDKVSKKE